MVNVVWLCLSPLAFSGTPRVTEIISSSQMFLFSPITLLVIYFHLMTLVSRFLQRLASDPSLHSPSLVLFPTVFFPLHPVLLHSLTLRGRERSCQMLARLPGFGHRAINYSSFFIPAQGTGSKSQQLLMQLCTHLEPSSDLPELKASTRSNISSLICSSRDSVSLLLWHIPCPSGHFLHHIKAEPFLHFASSPQQTLRTLRVTPLPLLDPMLTPVPATALDTWREALNSVFSEC